MMTLGSFLLQAAETLDSADLAYGHGTAQAFDEAAFIVLESLGLPPDSDLEALWDRPIDEAAASKISALLEARIRTRKPAPYLLNKAYIQGIPFYVDERVIVPRSFIAEILLCDDEFAPPGMPRKVTRVLDLCTGSGCLAIIAAMIFPDAHVDAVDLSADALAVAEKNVAMHGLADCITLYKGDLFAPIAGKTYDLIITNPPYVDAAGMNALPPEYRHEPSMALAAGADGLDLVHSILRDAPRFLTPEGGMVCEIGRCKPALEAAYPDLPFLWLETENSEDEVFWITQRQVTSCKF